MELKTIPISYGMGANAIVNDKLKRVEEIKQSVKSDDIDFSILEKVKSCSCDEIPNILNSIISNIDIDMDVKKFISLISLINGLVNIINTRNVCTDICDSIKILIKKVNDIYKKIPNENTSTLTNDVNQCISNLNTLIYKCKNVHEKAEVIDMSKINEIQSGVCNESVILDITSNRIYSENNPNGTNVVGRNVFPKNPDDILSGILNSDSDEQFMNRLNNIKKYIDMYKLNIDSCDISKIENLIGDAYIRLVTNNTGLSKLREAIVNAYMAIDSRINDFESHNAINHFKEEINRYIEKIDERMLLNEKDESVHYETDIMTEFGFGFMYEYPVDMTLDEAISFNNELNNLSDRTINEYMAGLTEAMDVYKQEEKMRRKQEKREQRARDRETIKYKGRILTLTNSTARNAMNGIKRTIRGIGVGAAVGVVVPQLGLVVGGLSIISAFCRSKFVPSNDKKRIVLDLRTELKIIDDKISDMERAGDTKNKERLMRIKGKMEETYRRLSYNMFSGDIA